MLDTQINSTYTDSSGNRLIYSDDVLFTIFYDASSESWNRSDSTATWYKEYQLPNDSFLFGYNSSIWDVFNDKSDQVSYSFSEGLILTATKVEARGGLTSEGKWTLIGDFSVSICVSMYDYYNEYRSKTSTGFSVSSSDSQKVGVSIYFNGVDDVILRSQYVSGIDLKYIGWFALDDASPDLSDCIVILNLQRSSNTISCTADIGSTTYDLGYVDGSEWSGDCYVEVELETEQVNSCISKFTGFFVNSGTISTSSFNKCERGYSASFPEKALISVDAAGLSIIDYDSKSLWSRFYSDSDRYFDASTTNDITAANGKIFCASENGVNIIDFTSDSFIVVDSSGKSQSLDGLDKRNAYLRTTSVSGTPSLTYNQVNSIDSIQVGSFEYVSAATSSGIVLIKDVSESVVTTNPYHNVSKTKFSETGSLFWFCSDPQIGRAKLAKQDNIPDSWAVLSDQFSPTLEFDKDSQPFSLVVEDANCLGVAYYDGDEIVAVGNDFGVEVLNYPKSISSYGGTSQGGNYISDPSFESYFGVYWTDVSNCYLPLMHVVRSDYWSSDSTYSAKFYVGDRTLDAGSYVSLNQNVDFTYIDYLLYDLNFVNGTSYTNVSTEKFEVLIDDVVYATYEESGEPSEHYVYLDEVITTTSVTGTVGLEFRLTTTADNLLARAYNTGKAYYLDNLRTNSISMDYQVFSSTISPVIRDVEVFLAENEKKVLFVNDEGLGFIDIDSNSMEFYAESSTVVSGSELRNMEVYY